MWNRSDYRPLEGFVYAVTPFNFTAIAGNLPTAPALMGNVVVWKPAPTQSLAAHLTMQVLIAAGLPAGVINLVTGDGLAVSEVALADENLAGIHFTGSTATFRTLWREVATNRTAFELPAPGGGDRREGLRAGAPFCGSGRAAYGAGPRSVRVPGAEVLGGVTGLRAAHALAPVAGRPGRHHRIAHPGTGHRSVNFMGALIDERAYTKNVTAIERARGTAGIKVLAGGRYDDEEGWFVRPTVLVGEDPGDEMFSTEYFGPILSVHVYPDRQFAAITANSNRYRPTP